MSLIEPQLITFEIKYNSYEKNNFINYDFIDDGEKTIIVHSKTRTFNLMNTILETATYINHITGTPFIRTSILYREILLKFITEIQLIDEDPKLKFKPDQNNIQNLNYQLGKEVAKRWLILTA